MRLTRAVPRVASLPELRTYKCNQCGVTVTEAEEPRESGATLSRVAFSRREPRGGERTMDSHITSKSGLANDFWLQMAALAILTIVVVALAAKYVW